jgi:broad specificity phosphatase PhoE
MEEEKKGSIYIVRHGQASITSTNYDQLSRLGVEQASALGKWFATNGKSISHVVTGNMVRQLDTAKAFMAHLPNQVNKKVNWSINLGFNEFDHLNVISGHNPEMAKPGALGTYVKEQGDQFAAFQHIFVDSFKRWVDHPQDHGYQESWSDFKKRTIGALQAITEKLEPGQNVLVVTSAGPISAICHEIIPFPQNGILGFMGELVNCGMTKFNLNNEKLQVEYVNIATHLKEGENPNLITFV